MSAKTIIAIDIARSNLRMNLSGAIVRSAGGAVSVRGLVRSFGMGRGSSMSGNGSTSVWTLESIQNPVLSRFGTADKLRLSLFLVPPPHGDSQNSHLIKLI